MDHPVEEGTGIKIPKGNQPPYFTEIEQGRWRAFIRLRDENILANKIVVNAMMRKYGDEGTYISYTENDKILLQYLEQNEWISFSKYRKMTRLSPYKAEKILTNFLALDVIEAVFHEKTFLYRLSGKFANQEIND